jgi:hypothetical protein
MMICHTFGSSAGIIRPSSCSNRREMVLLLIDVNGEALNELFQIFFSQPVVAAIQVQISIR